MPRPRPATTGYERLAQADRFSDDGEDDGGHPAGLASLQSSAAAAASGVGGVGGVGGGSSSSARYAGLPGMSSSGGGDAASALAAAAASHQRRASASYLHGHGGGRRRRANSGVDLKAINARLERWADEIAAKFTRHQKKRGGGGGGDGGDEDEDERLEIHYSVFQAPEGVRPATAETLARTAAGGPDAAAAGGGAVPDSVITAAQFEAIVDSVRAAIRQGTHPRMISQGSSGSYFARNPDGQVVGVFKPKDEEPYAAGNPKWNKWIHRNLFPCCFGRACLIPNLSYVSEAAAYVLDAQLRTYMVPYTDVVYLASKAFHYPFWDRYSYSRNRKPLPAKPGSFQVFLQGFKDANLFLREHPWPDQYLSGVRTSGRHRSGRRRAPRWADNCRPRARSATSAVALEAANGRSRSAAGDGLGGGGAPGGDANGYSDYDEEEEEEGEGDGDGGAGDANEDGAGTPGASGRTFAWTETLKQSFREELEKLVILDYIMRNTDRGLDNWMIKVDWSSQAVSLASEPMHLHMDGVPGAPPDAPGSGSRSSASRGPSPGAEGPRPVDLAQRGEPRARAAYPTYRAPKPMDASTPPAAAAAAAAQPTITIGAIDNSLSWPWKHPDAWRSFPFGWLFLPVDLIGRPFSQKTRDHFLPLLTSPAWWSQTQRALRRVFQMDPDFQERMFARQMAVMKGQAWNVVETLKTPDHGPLELTRRAKVCVWDDLVEVPIAVPMRATSAEIRRRNEFELARAMQEEMDIGAIGGGGRADDEAAAAAASHQAAAAAALDASEDLLLPATSPLPNRGRFELTKEAVAEEDETAASGSGGSGGSGGAAATGSGTAGSGSPPSFQALPQTSLGGGVGGSHASAAASLHHTSPRQRQPQHQRRYSYTTAASRRNSNSIAQQLYGERHGGGGGGGSSGGGGGIAGAAAATAAAAAAPFLSRHHRAASFDHFSRRSGRGHGGYGYGSYDGGDYDHDYGDDGDDYEGGDLGYAAAEGMENNRRRVIVERLEPVKSKNPVFTWC